MGFADGSGQLFHRPRNLFRIDDGWWSEQNVISRNAVHTALHGIEQEPAFQGCSTHFAGKSEIRGKGPLRIPVGYEFDGPEETDAPDISDRFFAE